MLNVMQATLPYCFLYLISLLFYIPAYAQSSQAQCYTRLQDTQQQIEQCRALLRWPAGNTAEITSEQQADTALKLAELYTSSGHFEQASQVLTALQYRDNVLSAEQKIQLLRRQGILSYRQGQRPQALRLFSQAVLAARINDNPLLLAMTLSDTGTAYLAMTQYAEAIDHYRESLALKEQHQASASSQAVTLNNIGTVFRKLADWTQAEHYLSRAIQFYQQDNNNNQASHSQEELSLVFLQQGDNAKAIAMLQQALAYFQTTANQHAELRVTLLLADAALNHPDIAAAARWLKQAEQLELQLGPSDQSVMLKLQLGRLLQQQGHYQQAEAILNQGQQLATSQQATETHLQLLRALVDNAVTFKQWHSALQYQQQLTRAQLTQHQDNFAEALAQQRSQLEYEQQQKAIGLLSKDNEIKALQISVQRNQLFMLLSAGSLLLLLLTLLWYWQQRKRQRARQRLEAELAWHARQFADLGASHSSLKAAFGQLKLAIMIFNNKQQLIFINDACCHLFALPTSAFSSLLLSHFISPQNDRFWQLWNNDEPVEHEFLRQQCLQLGQQQYQLDFSVSMLAREEPLTLLVLSAASQATGLSYAALMPQASFSQMLVDLLLSSLTAWEESTNSSRIELAEQSGIWRVSIDDGRIRTRSLDRYLSVKTLPKHPRWREVLRTAHFVLAQCPLPTATQQQLVSKLDGVTAYIRAQSLL
ncbi:tetratricopeptide repeat protein [Rheinheimera maricola]|uniref:Tetratricopeptide repeat protein n=1 Tax=Rheinheimera maricola TaxID=2793282 RepID=A0ABS7XAD5_9GAMM|nr:tetratricopeptide repeat protein [Rheinheimera maricola]MBZ9611582.1 tetratricopeptide repeat protein [Rheinheimera maricola]